jgi:cellulose synthase/poly-beta-1,6-N-acetylglucosamine synthase-like glycosyltransferase
VRNQVTPLGASAPANANDPLSTHPASGYVVEQAASRPKQSVLNSLVARRQQARNGQSALYGRLSALGVTHDDFVSAVMRSKQSGASAIQELISYDIVDAQDYYRKLAQDMDVGFATHINPDTILTDMSLDLMEHSTIFQIFGRNHDGLTLLYVAPDFGTDTALYELFERDPEQKKRVRICAPKTIAAAIEARKSNSSLDWATSELHQKQAGLSAKQVFAPWQAFALGILCVALPICLYIQFVLSSIVIHVAATLLFSAVIAIRVAALRSFMVRKAAPVIQLVSPFPKYSVLIALHKEAAIARQLVQAMCRLDWPISRLEVLYVCEADDNATIEALLAVGLPSHHRIIKVPAGSPRTKPKALNFALKACRTDFVVIYDAEDRPHPQQLKEAWSKFCQADETLACLQAPLVVTNASASWLARMFTFEYAAHFYGLLPYLAEAGVPLPLGGTSNHFRKSALEAVGGWDPHNVTEDADLGIRFCRLGFKCDVLHLPTLEDGPETFKEWYPQRTRWQKGWMQTFLVHNRNVTQLFDVLGRRNGLYFEALLIGFILSPLLYIAAVIMAVNSIYTLDPAHMMFTAIDLSLLSMGYVCSIALGFKCIKDWSRKEKAYVAATLPIYWLILSAAAWRAVYQLVVKPHYWEKTPHKPIAPNRASNDHVTRGTSVLLTSNPDQ